MSINKKSTAASISWTAVGFTIARASNDVRNIDQEMPNAWKTKIRVRDFSLLVDTGYCPCSFYSILYIRKRVSGRDSQSRLFLRYLNLTGTAILHFASIKDLSIVLSPVGWEASMLAPHGGRCHAGLRVPHRHACKISTHYRPSIVFKRIIQRPCSGSGRDDPSGAPVAPKVAEVKGRHEFSARMAKNPQCSI